MSFLALKSLYKRQAKQTSTHLHTCKNSLSLSFQSMPYGETGILKDLFTAIICVPQIFFHLRDVCR